MISAFLFACGLLLVGSVLRLNLRIQLINYGMSTGTTATGFVLLRVIDKDLASGAAEDYALAAPLSAPFVGGGMLTLGLPALVLERGVHIAIPVIVLVCVMCGLFLLAKGLAHDND